VRHSRLVIPAGPVIPAEQRPVLLAVDGNSLVHRSFHAHAHTGARSPDGAPVWAVRGFLGQLVRAVQRVGARAVVVGFDDHTRNVRKERWPEYKATRIAKPGELVVQLARTVALLRAAGLHVVVAPGLEADDVVASAARTATTAGWDTVVVTSDRDAFALVSDTTRVLRLITGGVDASPLLTPQRLHTLTGVRPHQYREFAALRGDTSDNLDGVRGIGVKTAARLLSELATVAQALAEPERAAQAVGRVAAARLSTPQARGAFTRNIELMTPVDDVDLELDLVGAGAGCLPLPERPLRDALAAAGLVSSERSAVHALCDAPPEEPALGVDSAGVRWLMSDTAHLDLLVSLAERANEPVQVRERAPAWGAPVRESARARAPEPAQGTLF